MSPADDTPPPALSATAPPLPDQLSTAAAVDAHTPGLRAKFVPGSGVSEIPSAKQEVRRRPAGKLLTMIRQPLIVVPVLTVIVAVMYFLPRDHAFVISAETKGVVVVVTNQTSSQWLIPEADICEVKSPPPVTAPLEHPPITLNDLSDERMLQHMESGAISDRPDDAVRSESALKDEPIPYVAAVPCGTDGYDVEEVVGLEVMWPVGTRLHIARNDGGSPLVVTVKDVGLDGPATVEVASRTDIRAVRDAVLAEGTRIVIPHSAWRRMGPLTFAGAAVIGILPSAGSNDELLSGRYEIFEELTFNDNPVKVKSDVFVPGDQVEVVNNKGQPVPGRGFVSSVDLPNGSGLRVVLTTPTVASELVIDRLGATPARQNADWTDRALNDPSALAIASVLGLVLATVEFLSKINAPRKSRGRSRGRRRARRSDA